MATEIYEIIITEGEEYSQWKELYELFITEFQISLPSSVSIMYRMWLYVEGYL